MKSGTIPADAWELRLGTPGFPPAFERDPKPPEFIFGRGDRSLLGDEVSRVAIVGARKCTNYGRDVARRLGRELASSGVSVVSGLALGIDAAAHEGVLRSEGAPPVAVVGSGLDKVYPRRNAALWAEVAIRGCLITEAPMGAAPEQWRFPARNRLIAALAEVIVVVEAHTASGTRHTIEAAIDRGVPVMAVPGPVGSAASEGSNHLLREGCAPACDTDDILMALGIERGSTDEQRRDLRLVPSGADAQVLGALDWSATSLETVLRRTTLGPAEACACLYRLQETGWARGIDGWWERIAAPGGRG